MAKAAKTKPESGSTRRRGRPPGRTTTQSIRFRVSAPYKEYLEDLAETLSGSVADVLREGVRKLAKERGLADPPLT